MATSMPVGYANRYSDAKLFEKHLFLPQNALQGAELNEIQEYAIARLKRFGGALFKDGDVIRNAQVIIDRGSGSVQAQAGAVYLRGDVRGVPARNFTIPVTGEVSIGVYLLESVVTALEDPSLRDPVAGTRNYQEPGAARLKVEPRWGWDGELLGTEFYPVYEVLDGVLKAKEVPPSMEAISQAIARYDRDSAGGGYVVSGLNSTKLNDLQDGTQVYSVSSGKAYVRGFPMEFKASTRLEIDPTPDLNFVDSEPQVSESETSQRVDLDYTPVANITSVRITKRKTVTMTHGAYSGAMDQIEDEAVLLIESVTQGGVTYTQGTDYRLTGGKVDWSLSGAEPATGSTYTVVYQAITVVTPTSIDSTGCSVSGAVLGSLILVSYNQKLPRIDRICVDDEGVIRYVKGVSSAYNPTSPVIPKTMLPIATVVQTWDSKRKVINDGVRVFPMDKISELSDRVDLALSLIAQQRLESDINVRNAGAKKGLFTDPFIDDEQRDQGILQNGAIFDGELTLPVSVSVAHIDSRGPDDISTLHFSSEGYVLQQTSYTTTMKVNPYMAFAPLPAEVTLRPAIDRWVALKTVWASRETQTIVKGRSGAGLLEKVVSTTTTNSLLSTTTRAIDSELRQIDVLFSIDGFGAGEQLASVKFDGVSVTPSAV